jgi:aspartyl-tRNA(Asn)/glutamyl-tRNA(Gln) amidotransferase subunit C
MAAASVIAQSPVLCHNLPMDLRELEETAALAHLNVNREELAAAFPAFEQMLGFFAAMQSADTDATALGQTAQFVSAGQAAGARLVGAAHFRGDVPPDSPAKGSLMDTGGPAGTDGVALVDNAGERDGRFIVIPNVL